MKINILFLVLGLMTSLFSFQNTHAESTIQTQGNNKSVTLDLQNMTCAMCKFTIKKALQSVDGVKKVNVDSDRETAAIIFDPKKTNLEALIKATTHAGYPATVRQTK